MIEQKGKSIYISPSAIVEEDYAKCLVKENEVKVRKVEISRKKQDNLKTSMISAVSENDMM